jgi:hypothetical protein
MSKFLDRLEQINTNASAPMGFGARRSPRAPGMALVTLVSAAHAAGCEIVASVSPDGALLSGVDGADSLKGLAEGLTAVPWGVQADGLNKESAQSSQEAGGDMVAFGLPDTAVGALSSKDAARILCLGTDVDERQLRAIEALPVDVIMVRVPGKTGAWTLGELATVTAVTTRTSKYVLVEVSAPPEKQELEMLRDAGIHGLALDVGAVSQANLSDLKQALQDMPRPQPNRRDRHVALLPASAFPQGDMPSHADPDEEEDDE